MLALFWGVALASLLGSLHCVGMCGGFVTFYAGAASAESKRRFALSHVAYNGGRMVTYIILGALSGGLGAALNKTGILLGAQNIAIYAAGVLMILWGVFMLARQQGLSSLHFRLPRGFQLWLQRRHQSLRDKPPLVRAGLLGLLSTFLPCGWLYAFAVTASGTGSPVKGGIIMFAFWLGTVPALLGLGLSVQHLSLRFRKALPTLSAVAILMVGFVTLWQRTSIASIPAIRPSHTAPAATKKAKKKPAIPTKPLGRCCH
jgi:sulfite exporter TauE/SafE